MGDTKFCIYSEKLQLIAKIIYLRHYGEIMNETTFSLRPFTDKYTIGAVTFEGVR
jgi:hypothetical protein